MIRYRVHLIFSTPTVEPSSFRMDVYLDQDAGHARASEVALLALIDQVGQHTLISSSVDSGPRETALPKPPAKPDIDGFIIEPCPKAERHGPHRWREPLEDPDFFADYACLGVR
ncbi:hypothetical protein ABTY59_37315 [Streptomyces sp. NPDC096079]|uniref:hypothetical protein n=1 Tax=Streptomyces sp. NPDC096079 TaxID=3155820 RepID=UPI003318597D